MCHCDLWLLLTCLVRVSSFLASDVEQSSWLVIATVELGHGAVADSGLKFAGSKDALL